MKKNIHLYIEEYLFFPNILQRIISYLLLPLSAIYITIVWFKKIFSIEKDFGIPIVSVGNLVVGGCGKTPVTIKLASSYKNIAVVLRGYGRKSKGLYVVSDKGKILVDEETSGDEAMLLAKTLKNATIIVSENRSEGIKEALKIGSKIIFLDDGFSKYNIKKFDILLKPADEPINNFCLPSGGYRELKTNYDKANLVMQEDYDYERVVKIINPKTEEQIKLVGNNKILLLTAISKPKRLLKYLPRCVKMLSFKDHYEFKKNDIEEIKKKYKDYFIIVTSKDFVKLEKFNINNIFLMSLDIKINKDLTSLTRYIKNNTK